MITERSTDPARTLRRWLGITTFFFVVGAALFASLFAYPRLVHAANCVNGTMTYGDAPSSYGEACQTPLSTLHIGPSAGAAAPFVFPCATGLANCNPNDNFLDPLTPIDLTKSQYTWTVTLSNTTGSTAYLAGWIDWKGIGNFTSTTPVTVNVPNNSTMVTLTWNIPITATPNITTYVRLRLSSQITGTTSPTAAWGNGEVEDYVVTTVSNALCKAGTSFYYIQAAPGTQGSTQDVIASVNATTGITTFVNNPPTPSSGVTSINGLAVNLKNGIIYYQDDKDGTTPAVHGIFGYHIVAGTNFTVTSDASASPLSLPLSNGWATASGAFGNGKYYVGIDGDDSGRIYEITLDSTGTTALSARNVISPAVQSGCVSSGSSASGVNCRGYGDLMVDGNRIYVALWQSSPETQIFDVYDLNSGLRLSRQTISLTGFAYQLGRDGNGQIYAVRSDNGAIYRVTNGAIDTSSAVSTIGAPVRDASECIPNSPTAVALSSIQATADSGIPWMPVALGIAGLVAVGGVAAVTKRRRS